MQDNHWRIHKMIDGLYKFDQSMKPQIRKKNEINSGILEKSPKME
jgi:hypothetical protein